MSFLPFDISKFSFFSDDLQKSFMQLSNIVTILSTLVLGEAALCRANIGDIAESLKLW